MSQPEQSEAKLDECFVLYLSFATAALQHVRAHEEPLCRAWLHKLGAQPAVGGASKKVRNVYMFNLVLQMQEGALKTPFSTPPPAGKLRPPAEVFPPEKTTTKEPAWLQAIARGTGADLLHSSKDGRLFLTSRYLENGQGAMSYLAISVADKEPLFLTPSQGSPPAKVKDSDCKEESLSSACCSEERGRKGESTKQSNGPDRRGRCTVAAEARRERTAEPQPPCGPSVTQRERPPVVQASTASAPSDRAPTLETAGERMPLKGHTLRKIFKTMSNISSQQTTFSSKFQVGMELRTAADPSATGEAREHANLDASRPTVLQVRATGKKNSHLNEATREQDSPRERSTDDKRPRNVSLPAAGKEPAVSVRSSTSVSQHSSAPGTSRSGATVAVSVRSQQGCASSRGVSAELEASAEDSDLTELFERRGAAAERRELLRRLDSLVRHTDEVLRGRAPPGPELLSQLRQLGVRYQTLVRSLPADSRPLWLLRLLRDKLLGLRLKFVKRMTKLDCIHDALPANQKQKKHQHQHPDLTEQFRAEDIDLEWRAEVFRMPSPKVMSDLKKTYHTEVVNRFLHYLVQEKIAILKKYQSKFSKKEKHLKAELQQEIQKGYENYNAVLAACREVDHVLGEISDAVDGCRKCPETQKEKQRLRRLEAKYAAMAHELKDQVGKACSTLKFETQRSRNLCDMIEAEKRRLEQMDHTFRESMSMKEAHKKELEEEIVRLSCEVDTKYQNIIDLNAYL
ncbi:uncharacterized protein LOC134532459 isoform X1 [Bacillus rossius redtenbacheri]